MFTAGCSSDKTVTLRVFNWEEYIDEGGEGLLGRQRGRPCHDRALRELVRGDVRHPIRVEYSTFGTNEDMYNQLQLGDTTIFCALPNT